MQLSTQEESDKRQYKQSFFSGSWVTLIIKSITPVVCRVDNAAFIENVGRCKKVLLFVRLCCCEFQRFNNFFCCHGLSLSFLLFHPGKPVIIGDKPRRGGGGPCSLGRCYGSAFFNWLNSRLRQTCRRRLVSFSARRGFARRGCYLFQHSRAL